MAKRMIYKTADGRRVPSVTTILGRFKDSGGLIYWANQQGLDGLTLEEARNQPASAGTYAHDLVEAHIHGWDRPELAPDNRLTGEQRAEIVRQAERALDNFKRWHEQSRIEFRHTEVNLVSETHRFGGRLDAVGNAPGDGLCIVDFKTGALYGEHLLQCAGYTLAWNETYPEHPLTAGAHILSFKRETADFSHSHFGSLDDEIETFVMLRALYDRVKRTEKRVK